MDAETKTLIPDANVILKDTKLGAASNRYGFYVIKGLTPGNYSLEVQFIGYKKQIFKNLVIATDQTTVIDFFLLQEEWAKDIGCPIIKIN